MTEDGKTQHTSDHRMQDGHGTDVGYDADCPRRGTSRRAHRRGTGVETPGGPSRTMGHGAFSRRGFIVAGAVSVMAMAGWAVFRFVGSLPFPISINDVPMTVSAGTTYQDLVDGGDLVVHAGDLLAVDGTVLTPLAGTPSTIYEAGVPVSDARKPIPHGAVITSANGDDVTEDTVTTTTPEPYTTLIDGAGAISTLVQQGIDGTQTQVAGVQSGIVVSTTETVAMQPLTITAANAKTAGDKVVALTFDDGPSPYTPAILDALAVRDARGTFFTLGSQVEEYPTYSVRAVSEGHQVATHSYSHPNMFELTSEQVHDEVQLGISALATATGVTTTTFRAPYGNWSEREWAATSDLITRQVIWNVDTEDWKRPGADAIVSNVMRNVKPGRIILMHDGGGDRSEDVAALPTILTNLANAGYRFVTVDELTAYL